MGRSTLPAKNSILRKRSWLSSLPSLSAFSYVTEPAAHLQKRRLDELCSERFPEYDFKAIQSWILQGKVTVKGAVVAKAGALVASSDHLDLNVAVAKYVCRYRYQRSV